MIRSSCRLSIILLAILPLAQTYNLQAQAPSSGPYELTSLLGRKLYALPDDPALLQARSALAAAPTNPVLALKLSLAQASRRQYREAVATDTAAIAANPTNAPLYLERGHRELGLRLFPEAQRDLERAAQLDPKLLDAHYHLGLAHYFQGHFKQAAASLDRARALAQSDDSLIDCSAWLYNAYSRAGMEPESVEVLSRITPAVKNTEPHLFFYLQLLHFYQGKLTAQAVLPPPPATPGDLEAELSFNTVHYGVANWDLVHHDLPTALSLCRQVVQGQAWNSWGFIASEIELHRSSTD